MNRINLKQKLKALQYHQNCAEQYLNFAATCETEKLRVKPREHAAYHERQAAYLVRELART